jgi:hypothetical protein
LAILRLVGLVLSGAISGVALVTAVVALLGIGWLAAAIPTVVVAGLGAGLTAVSHRWFAARKEAAKPDGGGARFIDARVTTSHTPAGSRAGGAAVRGLGAAVDVRPCVVREES